MDVPEGEKNFLIINLAPGTKKCIGNKDTRPGFCAGCPLFDNGAVECYPLADGTPQITVYEMSISFDALKLALNKLLTSVTFATLTPRFMGAHSNKDHPLLCMKLVGKQEIVEVETTQPEYRQTPAVQYYWDDKDN